MKFIYSRETEKLINDWQLLRMNFLHTPIAEYCERQIFKIKHIAIPREAIIIGKKYIYEK